MRIHHGNRCKLSAYRDRIFLFFYDYYYHHFYASSSMSMSTSMYTYTGFRNGSLSLSRLRSVSTHSMLRCSTTLVYTPMMWYAHRMRIACTALVRRSCIYESICLTCTAVTHSFARFCINLNSFIYICFGFAAALFHFF